MACLYRFTRPTRDTASQTEPRSFSEASTQCSPALIESKVLNSNTIIVSYPDPTQQPVTIIAPRPVSERVAAPEAAIYNPGTPTQTRLSETQSTETKRLQVSEVQLRRGWRKFWEDEAKRQPAQSTIDEPMPIPPTPPSSRPISPAKLQNDELRGSARYPRLPKGCRIKRKTPNTDITTVVAPLVQVESPHPWDPLPLAQLLPNDYGPGGIDELDDDYIQHDS